ncbi:uncharacterized protein Dvar_40580 [Desulfosarcina variabilis str. Montpellier]|uniref:hypothetical protein n=1 Tax=Desulfosarcina variabilis TaxID=2300 RepID=UPI003AFABF92
MKALKPSDIMSNHMLGAFGEQFKSFGMPKPEIRSAEMMKETVPSTSKFLDRKGPDHKDLTGERRLKILQISSSDLEDHPEIAEQLSKYLDSGKRTPLNAIHLIELLKNKYDLPPGTEVIEIVDVTSIRKERDIVFVMKLRNKDWDIISEGEYIPIYNPKTAEEDEKPLTIKSRRKSYITI